MSLTDAAFEVFQLLTQRPFLILDTEYTRNPHGDGDRLISLAIVPVVRGKRTRAGELYVEMNPGVPIDPASTAVHGFTDAEVARKRPFAHYAPAILAALAVPDAVLVQHTGSDLRVLRDELGRQAAGASGLAELPELPVVDTSTLPRQLRYPGVSGRGAVSLATLCALTGATNSGPHHARGDARATADALIKLLVHAAGSGSYASVDALLAAHDRGTTRDPRGPGYVRTRRDKDPVLPDEHLARHDRPLTHAGTDAERAQWLDLARECARLRCEHLRSEAAVAAKENGATLLDPLVQTLRLLAEPGQAGALLGAVTELLAPDDPDTRPALAHTRALRWWDKVRPAVHGSAACGPLRSQMCPDCRAGTGCPRDMLYQPITRIAILGERGVLDQSAIEDRLFGNRPDRRIHRWAGRHPVETAHMAWTVVQHETAAGRGNAAQDHLRQAVAYDLHLAEPRLALLVCQGLAANGKPEDAYRVAGKVLGQRTSDPGYDELGGWLAWQEQNQARAAREAAPRTITHPRLARPAGRVNANPYLPR